ncbi:MAG: hypothetical protein J6Y01_05340 [Spirochaetales bacterium]|nr:hypothetical protein [Spirochaetales bacterium]
MAIYGIGANYGGEDVSGAFIESGIVGTGWSAKDAPELFQYIRSLKVGDIVYIKSFSPSSPNIFIKGIGIIKDDKDLSKNDLVTCGRNVIWKYTEEFTIPKPNDKNNVRTNTIYEEFNPIVQKEILNKLLS